MINFKETKRIRIVFLLTTFFVLTLSFISYYRINDLADSAHLVNHSNLVKLELEKTFADLRESGSEQRGFVVTGDSAYLSRFLNDINIIHLHFQVLDSLIKDNIVQQQNLTAVRALVDKRINYLQTSIKDTSLKNIPRELWLKLKTEMDEIRAGIDKMINEENRLLDVRMRAVKRNELITPFFSVILIVSCLIILIITYYKINNDLQLSKNLQLQLQNRTEELEKNNAELASQNYFIETVLNSSEDIILVVDTKLRYLKLNEAAQKAYAPFGNVIGKSVLEVTPEIKETSAYTDLMKALNGETVYRDTFKSLIYDKYYENDYIPLKNNGEVYAVMMVVHDSTEIIKASEQVRLANEKLLERNAELAEQKLFAESLVEYSPYMILAFNKELNITIWNKNSEDHTGLPKEQVIGKYYYDVFPEYNTEEWRSVVTKVFNGESLHFQKIPFVRKEGWGDGFAVPLKNAKSEIIGLLLITLDITDKVNTLDKLKKSEERYHSMIAEVQDYAIIYLDSQGIIKNWNKGAEKIKGYREDEIIGKHFSIFYSTQDRKNNMPERFIEETKKNGRGEYEGWRFRKDGTRFWGSIVMTALHAENNQVVGFSKVTRDLTERKLAEDKIKADAIHLEQQNTELARKNAELTQFAYVSSHDLQEPLRKIQTFTSRIFDKELEFISPAAKDYLARIRSAAERMQTLIEDLLAYSRTNSGEKNFESTDLNILVQEILSELGEVIAEKNAIVHCTPLPKIKVIPFQFQQLLTNVISNSLKFSKPDVQPEIHISTNIVSSDQIPELNPDEQKNYFEIKVKDNGIGFDRDYRKKIFEVFQRLHGRDEYKGTGIGLAICKKIAENHNGAITADAIQGEGAVFNIYIPVS